jgi:hypothetical protein
MNDYSHIQCAGHHFQLRLSQPRFQRFQEEIHDICNERRALWTQTSVPMLYVVF